MTRAFDEYLMTRSILAAAVVLLGIPAHALQPSSACKLLEVAEIESALGGTAKKSPSGANQGGMDTCSIEMPAKGGVRVVTISVASIVVDGGGSRMPSEDWTRKPQWNVLGSRQKNVGDAVCITSGRPGAVGHSMCNIYRAGRYVEVDVSAPVGELVPMDTVGALVQKAAGRL
jgi:hypothetical protein